MEILLGNGENMELPKNEAMLLSYVNTQLRDKYKSLEKFCKAAGVEEEYIRKKLEKIDYRYDAELNKFI